MRALLLVMAGLLAAGPAAAWTQREFVLGTYWDVTVSDETPAYDSATVAVDLARFARVRDAGFNLLTGKSNYRSCNLGVDSTLADYLLYLAHRTGLRVLVADTRFHRPMGFSPEAAAAVGHRYSSRSLDPARRAALYGYHVRDEPGPAARDRTAGFVKAWLRHLRRADPERIAYVNLLPRSAFHSHGAYERYLDEYLRPADRVASPDVASFDHYPLTRAGVSTTYFFTLQTMATRAEGRPMWAYPLAIEHGSFLADRPEHFRFMAYCPIAYGAKGLVWFTYVKPRCPGNAEGCGPFCDGTALVDDAGRPTPKLGWVRSIHRHITAAVGPMVMRSTWLGTWHQANVPFGVMRPGWRVGPSTPLVRDLGSEHAMVGVFRDPNPGVHYLFVVNKALHPITATVALAGPEAPVVEAGPSEATPGTGYASVHLSRHPDRAGGAFRVALEGGEGRLFRVIRASAPPR